MAIKSLTNQFEIQSDIDMLDFMVLSPILFMIFADLNVYCHRQNLPLKITNIINERIPGVSVSDTHSQGRAIDISLKGWTELDINRTAYHFNKKYKSYGTSSDGLNNRVMVPHVGTGLHIHIQVSRSAH